LKAPGGLAPGALIFCCINNRLTRALQRWSFTRLLLCSLPVGRAALRIAAPLHLPAQSRKINDKCNKSCSETKDEDRACVHSASWKSGFPVFDL
jgi:hypothetical protein